MQSFAASGCPATSGKRSFGYAYVLLLGLALLACSCATPVQAAGNSNSITLSGSLPAGTVNHTYNAVLTVTGGSSPYEFSVSSGALPPGIELNRSTGSLTGSPSAPGTYTFEVLVTDNNAAQQGRHTFSIPVSSVQSGIGVSITPASVNVTAGAKQQFTATVTGTSKTAVTWSASSGTIDSTGLFTAPTVSSVSTVSITATVQAIPTVNASAAATVNPQKAQPLTITTSSLPQGQLGSSYDDTLAATGGTQPYTWTVSSGSLPAGITLNSAGSLTGAPSAQGTFSFAATVTDAKQNSATASLTMDVTSGSGYDGPAQLPIVTISTGMPKTPQGTTIAVNAGGDLQAALDEVQCGQTITLQAGATFTGRYHVHAKSCDANHWIIIRTSAPDSALPEEGQRLTPCYAGVASLVGRPAYNCPNPQNVLAKVQIANQGDGPFWIEPGANYYRFLGLEVTRQPGTGGPAKLIWLEATADHIFIDRSWFHGNPQDDTYDAIGASGGTYIALFDSYFTDFHCEALGTCLDSHVISGGVSDTQDGPYLIQDNFLEASGEEVMFGGGPANKTPTDITVQYNHFWKPWQWMPGSPGFVGGVLGHPFIVKNHLELKNAVRVLVQANIMENNWAGFTQHGIAVLLTPKNQWSKLNGNVCPLCQVTDVTLRYNRISHAGGGVELASAEPGKGGAAYLATRFSLHDLVMDDINPKYGGHGNILGVHNVWPKNPINTITINHVTALADQAGGIFLSLGDLPQDPKMYGFVFTNNLVMTTDTPIASAITGGCAVHVIPNQALPNCFTSYTFQNNGLIADPISRFPPSTWPSGNFFPSTPDAVGFVNFNNGNGGNYELQSSSPYKNKGTDGKDLGADVAGLMEQLANVE